MTDDVVDGIDFKDLFASVDAMDTEGFLSFIDPEATFRFGSSEPVTGHEEIRLAVDGFFASFKALKHELQRTVTEGNVIACEGEVTYTRHDGSNVTLPFVNIFEVDDGIISLYRVYVDVGPLYSD
jgi:limonene-1,2-epoxide hydrolase